MNAEFYQQSIGLHSNKYLIISAEPLAVTLITRSRILVATAELDNLKNNLCAVKIAGVSVHQLKKLTKWAGRGGEGQPTELKVRRAGKIVLIGLPPLERVFGNILVEPTIKPALIKHLKQYRTIDLIDQWGVSDKTVEHLVAGLRLRKPTGRRKAEE